MCFIQKYFWRVLNLNPPLKQGIKMKRPYVNLNNENIVSELLGALNESLDKFSNLKGRN